jgi:hypothetical protein
MPNQALSTVENNFTKGLVTEYTGLNFPENAATDTDNCTYGLVGDVNRRLGIDFEENFSSFDQVTVNKALNTYRWNNAGGDGSSQVVVVQNGMTLLFYASSNVTIATSLSLNRLSSVVDMTAFQTGTSPDPAQSECQFSSGNGYLFVYHPQCNPFFCSYSGGAITANIITVNIRDFTGVLEPGVAVTDRPTTLSNQHLYNLINQGWTQGSPWVAISSGSGPAVVAAPGGASFTVAAGIPGTTIGDTVGIYTTRDIYTGAGFIPAGTGVMGGVLSSYAGVTMGISITSDLFMARGLQLGPYRIVPYNKGYINTWQAALSNYPSNSDVWWFFKDNTNTFNPLTTINQVTINSGNAPRGHFIMNAFNLDRSTISTVSGMNTVSTTVRPRTGTWFQGRVWYAGVDASAQKSTTTDFYTWTENIYFSQTVVGPEQFGACHQLNDPTSETLFSLLPTDGGVITIQDAGAIYKLYPIQNGMLVFAANGIWFITGSQGIGFAANDYTITKISSVQCISGTSFVDVQGLPYFWNEEGIYAVTPSQNGGLQVTNVAFDTILSYYNEIPIQSKRYARGVYNPIDYTIQWIFRSISDGGNISSRYEYDSILNFNTYNKAFFPYSIGGGLSSQHPQVKGILYLTYPAGSSTPPPSFKYLCADALTVGNTITFADEHDTNYVDWASSESGAVNYDSFFVTGYKLHGNKGSTRFQIPYIYMFSRADEPTGYTIQSIWDYATSGNSGKWSSIQQIFNNKPYFGMIFRRHRLRGQGIVLQIKVGSVDGQPFDIMGWSTFETMNTGV